MRTLILDPKRFEEGGDVAFARSIETLTRLRSGKTRGPAPVSVFTLDGSLYTVTGWDTVTRDPNSALSAAIAYRLAPAGEYAGPRAPIKDEVQLWRGYEVEHGGSRYYLTDPIHLVPHPGKEESCSAGKWDGPAPSAEGSSCSSSVSAAPDSSASSATSKKAPRRSAGSVTTNTSSPPSTSNCASSAGPLLIHLSQIQPSPLNPRTRFDPAGLEELAASIRELGLIEPLVVRPIGEGRWEVIAGERRLRAAGLAGLAEVPVVIREATDEAEILALQLVENLQRADLNPIEEARGYRQLSDRGWKQSQIAAAVGKSQPVISNALRMLDLPEEVQQFLIDEKLSAAHGRALARWSPFPDLCRQLATWAVENAWPSKALESARLPHTYQLEQLGLVKELGWRTRFEWGTVCAACPYGAFLPDPQGGSSAQCLKPAHYDALQKEAIEAANAALRQSEADALAHVQARESRLRRESLADVAGTAEAGAKGGETAAVAAPEPPPAPRLEDLRYGDYERLDGSYDAPPAGCTAACPCRGVAAGADGALVSICLDPSRLRTLRGRETREKNKGGQQAMKTLRAELAAAAPAIAADDPRALAWIAARLLTHASTKTVEAALKARAIALPVDTWKCYSSERSTERLDLAATLTAEQLVRLMVVALGLQEIHEQSEYKSWDPTVTRWFLRQEEAPAPDKLMAVFAEEEADAPEANGAP